MKIEIIEHAEFFEQWDNFSVKDSTLSGEEWNDRYHELVKLLSADFLYTGKESAPADFWVGDDWFQTRVQCVVFFSWHFLCRRMLETCKGFVNAHAGWGVSIVNDDSEIDHDGPETEILIAQDFIKMAAREHSSADLKRFLARKTDLQGWI